MAELASKTQAGGAVGDTCGAFKIAKVYSDSVYSWVDHSIDESLTTSDVIEGANLYFTEPRVLSTDLLGFIAGAGVVVDSDSILEALEKIVGNIDNIDLTALLSDSTTVLDKTLSSAEIVARINAAIEALKNTLVGGAPSEFDTMIEIMTQILNNDDDISDAIAAIAANTVITDSLQAQIDAGLSPWKNPDGSGADEASTDIVLSAGTVKLEDYSILQNNVVVTEFVFVSDPNDEGLLKKISIDNLKNLLNDIELVISGYVITGQTLTTDAYGTAGGPSDLHQWYSDGVAIVGASSPTYVVTPNDEGTKITVVVNGVESNQLRNFTPLDIGAEVWIDPSSSLSGELINRGTGDQPVLASGTQQALRTINGITTHGMNGQTYTLPDQFGGDISNLTLLTAWKENTRTNTSPFKLNSDGGNGRSQMHIPWGDGTVYFDIQGIDDRFNTNIGAAGQTMLISYQNNATDAFANIYRTGDLNPSNPYEVSRTFNTPSDPSTGMVLGQSVADHDMLDQIVSARVLSTIARQKIEGYVAHKYQLQATLPDAHPYKVKPA